MMNMTTTTTEECDDWQRRSKSDGYSDDWLNDDSSDDNR